MKNGIRVSPEGKHIAFWCPGCRDIHGWIPLNRWTWDAATQTLNPSVRHFVSATKDIPERTTCHYNVIGGRIQLHDDSAAHQLRGWHDLDEAPPTNYGGREHFGWGASPSSQESSMTDETKDEKPAFAPTFMYHADEPAGRIFESQSEIDAAGDGWVDSPAAIGAEPAKGKKAKAGKDLA